jgi:hypothetical protein
LLHPPLRRGRLGLAEEPSGTGGVEQITPVIRCAPPKTAWGDECE